MTNTPARTWLKIGLYLLLTLAFSSVFYTLIIASGSLRAGGLLYVVGLMWCPGLAAMATKAFCSEPLRDLGWGWGPWRYAWLGYLIPVAYAVPVYLVVWFAGLGAFPNSDFLAIAERVMRLPALPQAAVLAIYFVLVASAGMISSSSHALGEEIGWRGFLLPELAKVMSVPRAALLSGLIWASWHYPILLLADYNLGTPWYVALPCFTVMVVGDSFILAWLRLRSGSLWPAVLFHASHNLWIQSILTPLTLKTNRTDYYIDEFGYGMAISACLAAVVVFACGSRRSSVRGNDAGSQR